MVEAMDAALSKREKVCDTLIGRFVQKEDSLEYGIEYDYNPSCSQQARDFCVLQKEDCMASKEVEETSDDTQLECPISGRNRMCEKFYWHKITAEHDESPYCLAVNVYSNATHNVSSCENHAANRLWFPTVEEGSKDKFLRELVEELQGSFKLVRDGVIEI